MALLLPKRLFFAKTEMESAIFAVFVPQNASNKKYQ